MKLVRIIIEAVGEGLVYDLICHLAPALIAWHLVTGTPARYVDIFAHHLDGVAIAGETR